MSYHLCQNTNVNKLITCVKIKCQQTDKTCHTRMSYQLCQNTYDNKLIPMICVKSLCTQTALKVKSLFDGIPLSLSEGLKGVFNLILIKLKRVLTANGMCKDGSSTAIMLDHRSTAVFIGRRH